MIESTPALKSMLADHQQYHSNFQIDNFIVSQNGETTWGMYKQAVRELQARWDCLRELYVKRAVYGEELQRSLAAPVVSWDTVEQHPSVRALRARMSLEKVDQQICDTEREFRRFFKHAWALKQVIGTVTPEQIQDFESAEWTAKLRKKMALEMLCNGKVSETTVDAVLACGSELKEDMLNAMGSLQDKIALIAWLRKREKAVELDRTNEQLVLKEADDALRHLQAG